jgi:hypothetical protein
MNEYKIAALEGLMNRAQTDRVESKASLAILLDFPAGIGDHSTSDLHNNLNESLSKLADAEDRIQTLRRNYPSFFADRPKTDPPF